MSRRRPTKAELNRVITIDLLADWRPYAEPRPEPRSDRDWRYFGTITINEQTGALAWRAGKYGIGAGAEVRELGMWDRIKIHALLMDKPPGSADVPRFTPSTGFGMTMFSSPSPAPKDN